MEWAESKKTPTASKIFQESKAEDHQPFLNTQKDKDSSTDSTTPLVGLVP